MTATDHHPAAAVTPEDRARLGRRAQRLAGASVADNAVEGVTAVAAGLVAGSVALIGSASRVLTCASGCTRRDSNP